MHVPDGFLDLPTSLATGAVAAAAVGVALRRSRCETDERTVPLAGLTCAFVFAAQMVNFPVGLGTSGHLMGGALAAVLVGPWTGMLCLSVVLLVQALLFADGGLTALGTNITLLGVTTVLVGWLTARGVLAVRGGRPSAVVTASAVGAFASVVAAALVFVLLYAAGGRADVALGPLSVTMLVWHALIALGEAALTAMTVGAVLAVRPDLVHAARGHRPPLVLLDARGGTLDPGCEVPSAAPTGRRSARPLLVGGGVVSLLIAGAGSFLASGSPDGLERVAAERGFLATAGDHLLAASPLAGYGEAAGIPVGVAGVLGVVGVVAVAALVLRTASRRPRGDRAPAAAHHG